MLPRLEIRRAEAQSSTSVVCSSSLPWSTSCRFRAASSQLAQDVEHEFASATSFDTSGLTRLTVLQLLSNRAMQVAPALLVPSCHVNYGSPQRETCRKDTITALLG